MKEAILKAIEGRWNRHAQDEPIDMDMLLHEFGDSMLLDPLFWQALLRAECFDTDTYTEDDEQYIKDAARTRQHNFIDCIIDGGTPEDFFNYIFNYLTATSSK
jgi:hypothetical protein